MPRFYKAAFVTAEGHYHAGVHALNLDFVQAIRPMANSKYHYAIFADRPTKEGGWRGVFIDVDSSDPAIFSSGDMIPVKVCGEDGLPMLGPACINQKFFTHFGTEPAGGRPVWMIYGIFPGMKLALHPEGSQALLSSQEISPNKVLQV